MDTIYPISEVYQKFLIEVAFENSLFFTVAGTGPSDEDCVLVDAEGKFLLFSTIDAVLRFVNDNAGLFDDERLKDWAAKVSTGSGVYASINIDVLAKDNSQMTKTDLLEEIYLTIGIIRDYTRQVEDTQLDNWLYADSIIGFYDIMSDYLIWGKGDMPVVHYDTKMVNPLFLQVYNYLKNNKIRIIG